LNWRETYYEEGYLKRWTLDVPGDGEFEVAAQFLRLGGATQGSRVLDLGCGHGRFSLGMARKTALVVGLDESWSLLQRGESFARQLAVPGRWVRADMRRLPFTRAFDLVLVVDAFGNSDADAEELLLLSEIHGVLRSGGRLVMRNPNGSLIRTDFRPVQEEHRPGRRISVVSAMDDDAQWLDQRIQVDEDGEIREYRRRQRIYSAGELTEVLDAAGFNSIKHYSSPSGDPFQDTSSARMVTVAHS